MTFFRAFSNFQKSLVAVMAFEAFGSSELRSDGPKGVSWLVLSIVFTVNWGQLYLIYVG